MSALAERAFVVPQAQVVDAWPQIAPIVSRVTDAPWTPADVLAQLVAGKAQAWGIREADEIRCVLVTRVESSMSHRYGVIWIAAGTGILEGLRLLQEYIEPWFFEEHGCEWIELQGRKGWRKVLPEYDEPAVVLRKYKNNRRA